MRPKKVILLVGADEVGQSVLSYILVTHAYKVVQATSGEQAIELFTSMQVDLVLADVDMHGMNGVELARKLKAIAEHIPIILLGDLEKMADGFPYAYTLLNKNTVSSAELLYRVKLLSVGKKGPKPGFKLRRAAEAQTA